jgi:hypothetical protein
MGRGSFSGQLVPRRDGQSHPKDQETNNQGASALVCSTEGYLQEFHCFEANHIKGLGMYSIRDRVLSGNATHGRHDKEDVSCG